MVASPEPRDYIAQRHQYVELTERRESCERRRGEIMARRPEGV